TLRRVSQATWCTLSRNPSYVKGLGQAWRRSPASPANAPPHVLARLQTPPGSSSSPIAPPPNSPTACTLQTPPHAHPSTNPPPPKAAPCFLHSLYRHSERSLRSEESLRVLRLVATHRHARPARAPQSARSPTAPVSPSTVYSSSP